MFESTILIGLIAVAICFLKRLYRNGLAGLAAGAGLVAAVVWRGDASAGDISTFTRLLIEIGFPVFALATVLLATPAAQPGSYWERRTATDANGKLLLEAEPAAARLGRAFVGGFLGVLPAALFLIVVAAWAQTGDEAQLGFLAIPMALAGGLFGGWVGHNWLPGRATSDAIASPTSAKRS